MLQHEVLEIIDVDEGIDEIHYIELDEPDELEVVESVNDELVELDEVLYDDNID